MSATDKIVAAIMARGLDFALTVSAGLQRAVLALDHGERATTPWFMDDGDFVRTTWGGDTVLARISPKKKRFVCHVTFEAGHGGTSDHGNARRARVIADQKLARLNWEVVAPEV